MFSTLDKKVSEVIKSLRQDTSLCKYIKPKFCGTRPLFVYFANLLDSKIVLYCKIKLAELGSRGEIVIGHQLHDQPVGQNYVKHL